MEWSWWFVVLAVTYVRAEPHNNVLVSLNTFKPLHHVSDNFLSLSVSPSQLLTVDNISESCMSLLEGLAPAYLQVGGVDSENFTLQTPDTEPVASSHMFTESQWTRLNLLAADTGLSLVFTLSTNISPWEFHTLLSSSDKQGFNPTYQYGSELSIQRQNVQTLRERVEELRRTLDSFPRYQNTALLCPDIQVDDDPIYVQELQEFLAQTGDVAPVFIVQGKPKSVRNERDIVESLREPAAFMDKVYNKQTNKTQAVLPEKKYQLWIAGSNEMVKKENSWSDAVVWTLRLGHAARQDYQALLWHPAQLIKPTLEYWVSLLHRQLVGGAVLNTRVVSGSSSGVSVFAHCAAYSETQASRRGAVVVWGVNLAHQATSLTLLTTFTPRVLVYSLTLQHSEPFLNGQQLSLSHGALPKLSPEVRQLSSNMSVDISPHSIFFLVLPDLRARACLSPLTTSSDEQINNLLWWKPSSNSESRATDNTKNYIVENGGVFRNSEDDLVHNRKLNGQLKNIQKIIEIDQQSAGSSKTVAKVNEDVEDWLEKLAIVNKSGILTQEELQTLAELIIDERPPESKNNKNAFEREIVTDIENVKNGRFKRSEDEETTKMLPNRLSLPVSSPLFRKLYFLRKIRPLNSSSLVLPKGLGDINPTIETKTEGPTANQIVTSSAKPKILIADTGNTDTKKQFTSKLLKNEESESIHYYPGEFYEMLGSLKIQSDVPLKDLAGSHEAIDSIISEELKCKECESKMQVIKKGENTKKEDDKVIENATESLNNYFIKVNKLKPYSDVNVRKEPGFVYQKYQEEPLSESTNSESGEKKDNRELQIPQRPIFRNSGINVNLGSQKRTKRDVDSFKYISQIFKNDNQEDTSNSSSINSSEEKELRQFLEELTIEGEELLEDFNENIERKNTYLKYNSDSTKEEEFKDEISEKKEEKNKGNEDYFLKNNLVVEEKPKSRRTYSPRLLLVSQNSLGNKISDNDWKTVEKKTSEGRIEVKPQVFITEEIPKVSQAVTFIQTTEKTPEFIATQEDIGSSDLIVDTSSLRDEQMKARKKYTTDYKESSNHELTSGKKEVVGLNDHPKTTEILKKHDLHSAKLGVVKLNDYPKVSDPLEKHDLYSTKMEVVKLNDNPQVSDPLEKHDLHSTKMEVVKLNGYPQVSDPLKKHDLPHSKTEFVQLNEYTKVSKPLESQRKVSNVENNSKESDILKITDTQLLGNAPEDYVHTDQLTDAKLLYDEDKTGKSKIPLLPKFNRNILHRYFNPLAAPTTHLSFQNSPSSPDKDKEIVGSSEVVVETPPLLKLILANRRKNRLNSIKQKLAKARERMVRLPTPRNIPVVKTNKKEVTLQKTTIPVEIEPAVDISNSADKKLYGRKKRQVSENLEKGKLEIEEIITPPTTVHPIMVNKTLEVTTTTVIPELSPTPVVDHIADNHHLTEELPIDDVLIESSQTPLHKWIIPLSNHTEKIILKNQIFPVKLYGILADEWAKEKNKSNDLIDSPNKEKRSIRYSCIKDRFYDDEVEEETQVVNAKEEGKNKEEQMSQSEIIEVKEPKDKKYTEITPILILSPESSHRAKRSASEGFGMTENKLKSLLTNEIIKERTRGYDFGSEDQDNFDALEEEENEEEESDFSAMLRKSVEEKVAAHKSGIERMFQLAKEYEKTNPESLEIFDTHKKVGHGIAKHIHTHKEEPEVENKSETEDEIKASKKDKTLLFSLNGSDDGRTKQKEKKNQTSFDESKGNFFSSFVNKNKEYFNNMNLFSKFSDDKNEQGSDSKDVNEHTSHSDSKSSNSSSENILTSFFKKSKDFIKNLTTYIDENWDSESKLEDD